MGRGDELEEGTLSSAPILNEKKSNCLISRFAISKFPSVLRHGLIWAVCPGLLLPLSFCKMQLVPSEVMLMGLLFPFPFAVEWRQLGSRDCLLQFQVAGAVTTTRPSIISSPFRNLS